MQNQLDKRILYKNTEQSTQHAFIVTLLNNEHVRNDFKKRKQTGADELSIYLFLNKKQYISHGHLIIIKKISLMNHILHYISRLHDLEKSIKIIRSKLRLLFLGVHTAQKIFCIQFCINNKNTKKIQVAVTSFVSKYTSLQIEFGEDTVRCPLKV